MAVSATKATKDVTAELLKQFEEMTTILHDPITMDLQNDMIVLAKCSHAFSKASLAQINSKNCPTCRKVFTTSDYTTIPVITQAVEQLMKMRKLLDPSSVPNSTSSKVEEPIVQIQIPNHYKITIPNWDPSKLSKEKNGVEIFNRVIPILLDLFQKTTDNSDTISGQHDMFLKILDWLQKLPIYEKGQPFPTYIYHHAYFVCVQKQPNIVTNDGDFGRKAIRSNCIPKECYSPIIFRTMCGWMLQEIADLTVTGKLSKPCIDCIRSTLGSLDSTNSEVSLFLTTLKEVLSKSTYWNDLLPPSRNLIAFLNDDGQGLGNKVKILNNIIDACREKWEKKS